MQETEHRQQTATLLCANFCDITSAPLNTGSDIFRLCRIVEEQAAENHAYANAYNGATARMVPQIARIYVGSYFCDRFFLALRDEFFDHVADFCHACDLSATLVVPVFSQSMLPRGTKRIASILDAHPALFDEVTVNDYGMAAHLSETCRTQNMAMNWGRLFMKEPRDPRYAETSQGCRACAIDGDEIARLTEDFPIGAVELDPFSPVIDVQSIVGGAPQGALASGAPTQGAPAQAAPVSQEAATQAASMQAASAQAAPIALHLPHCFMSTGHICEAASATCAPDKSFRADMPCSLECRRSFSVSISEGITTEQTCYLMKNGRTVFFENPFCEIVSDGAPAQVARIIWSPEDFAFSLPEDAAGSADFADTADSPNFADPTGFAYEDPARSPYTDPADPAFPTDPEDPAGSAFPTDPARSAFPTDENFPWREQGGQTWA